MYADGTHEVDRRHVGHDRRGGVPQVASRAWAGAAPARPSLRSRALVYWRILAVQGVAIAIRPGDFFLEIRLPAVAALIGGLAITIYVAVIAQIVGRRAGHPVGAGRHVPQPALRAGSAASTSGSSAARPSSSRSSSSTSARRTSSADRPLPEPHRGRLRLDLHGAVLAGHRRLGINEGAYMSEIVRAGILSVDPGQTEAAKSLGHDLSADDDAGSSCRRRCG